MRLKAIKLSGFKSFVDPTVIPINADLIGIVGPNGCGKSNIIDAIRWVMGESSAKHLRGDSMADVVFNGSNSRKPVAQASVELVFDNSDGRAGGEYAKYAEIAIRREAGRDGQSDYFLNKTRCRRKDITDLFLGTGLGPRAYSIIEQGMVTRIIEAKPEDLRGFIEEAAGISRYKERRRETENRIRHTRENLARVEDIRKEIGSQLARLEKQSKAAAKYKELKQEERLVRAQLGALRYRELDARLQEQERQLAAHQNALDAALADQRATETDIEQVRAAQHEATEGYNAVHTEFYTVGGEISRLEQAIEHARETRANLLREQEQLERTWDEAGVHRRADDGRLAELNGGLDRLRPQIEEQTHATQAAAAALHAADGAMQNWQQAWEAFARDEAERGKQREIQTTRRIQLEQHLTDTEARRQRLEQELLAIEPELATSPTDGLRHEAEALDRACEEDERALGELDARLRDTRAERERLNDELDRLRQQLHAAEARLQSLHDMQAAAAEEDDAQLADWMRARGLDKLPRLAARLTVEPGWERAVERVLGSDLVALCVPSLNEHASAAQSLNPPHLAFVEAGAGRGPAPAGDSLLAKLQSDVDLSSLLADIQVEDTLDAALARRAGLTAHESIVTRDGAWVGRNWLSLAHDRGKHSGWLAREREIETLTAAVVTARANAETARAGHEATQTAIAQLERERDARAQSLNERNRSRAQVREQLGHQEARLTQLTARGAQLRQELSEIGGLLSRDRSAIDEAGQFLLNLETDSATLDERRSVLTREREERRIALEQARVHERSTRDTLHRLQVEQQGLQTARDSVLSSIARLENQVQQLGERRAELNRLLSAEQAPEVELKARLDECLAKRLEVEGRLNAARETVTVLDGRLREHELARHAHERRVQQVREAMEAERVARESLTVRRDTLGAQIAETGHELTTVLAELPAEAAEEAWQERLEKIGDRVERLGPINLVAIEEFQEYSQRKEYLDKQNEDLTQALATLEEAIRKIDRETRTRFKETYDKVDDNFKMFFPKLFGGGSAYLELTDNDLLETGVAVMARPPGKRNSTIHLLSGGEKALTAVALIFAIFELNPAPFCLLDEVDAPLDDANVVRYSETLKSLSERTQLLYVTHNKISMEMAELLLGVTMSEPGVSRLVAVDVDEALRMVAQS
jgi:chromosome segregation protein